MKVINPYKRSEYKAYLIRDVELDKVKNTCDIRSMLKEELMDQIPSGFDFDIGFYKGSKQIWIRNDKDAVEVLHDFRLKSECTLWSMGVKSGSRKRSEKAIADRDSSDSDDASNGSSNKQKRKPKKSKNDEKRKRVDDIMDELVEQHESKYTHLQYRVWAETIVVGRQDYPPKGSFFKMKKDSSSSHNGEESSTPLVTSLTPGKCAQLRSTYIKQIRELHELLEMGAISDTDFE